MTKVEVINALAELERLGVAFEPVGDAEVRLKCPVHEDKTPSVALNTERNVWICHAAQCKAKGDIVSLLAHFAGCKRQTMIIDLGRRYDIEEAKTINPKVVEDSHKAIWEAGPLKQELHKRGLDDNDIRIARLGYRSGRITIPVYLNGQVVNIRRYLPGAPGPEKMKNTPGYGKPRLYQHDQLGKYDDIWICGGELKALVAAKYLNPENIGAVAVTAGEGAWEDEWNELFRGKRIFICMDIDEGGRVAARRLASRLHNFCDVFIISLPLDQHDHPKGDLNDYVYHEKAGTAELIKLMEEAPLFKPRGIQSEDVEAVEVHISQATDQRFIGRPIKFEGIVSMQEKNPYLIPKGVDVTCTRDQPVCVECPITSLIAVEGVSKTKILPGAAGLLEMIDAPAQSQREGIRKALGIPKCKVVEFKPTSHYVIRDTRITPQLAISSEASNNVMLPGYTIDAEPEMNTPYTFEGTLYPSPRNQTAILLLYDTKEAKDNLESFTITDEDLEALQVFHGPLEEKLEEIYADLEANVTRIFFRREMHLLMDLAYHAPLLFNFDGRQTYGWVNVLVVGDSSQGKSESSIRLMEHYGLGARVECKNASVAGLIGGLQQIGNRWFVSWGAVPTHDRRLLFLEEVKGAPVETIGKMTDMRSSGIAEIPKIEHRRAHARTRLVFISNPRSNRSIASYSYGIMAIPELIGGLEDVRRFDAACIVSADQVDADAINRLHHTRTTVEHVFTSDLCRKLVLWAWTLKPSDIEYTDGAVETTLDLCASLCRDFSEKIPLVDRGTMRFKVARLAAALAARTFCVRDGVLTILPEHVEYVVALLRKLYGDPVFGYSAFSKAQTRSERIRDPEIIKTFLRQQRHADDLVANLQFADTMTLNDVMDWCDLDRDGAQAVVSFLVRKRAIYRKRSAYRKSAEFIPLLADLEEEGLQAPEPNINDEY